MAFVKTTYRPNIQETGWDLPEPPVGKEVRIMKVKQGEGSDGSEYLIILAD